MFCMRLSRHSIGGPLTYFKKGYSTRSLSKNIARRNWSPGWRNDGTVCVFIEQRGERVRGVGDCAETQVNPQVAENEHVYTAAV